MQKNNFETKNFIITDLGEACYEGNGETNCYNEYLVKVKNIDCLDIVFELDDIGLIGYPTQQKNDTVEGKKLTDFTFEIIYLIQNDIADIINFMGKHM